METVTTRPPRLRQHPSGRWYAHWFDGKQRKKAMKTNVEEVARERFAAFLLRYNDAPRINHYIEKYENERVDKLADPHRQIRALRHVRGFFGDMFPQEITPEKIKEYTLLRPVADPTVRRELVALRTALNWGRDNGDLKEVPKIKLPKDSKPRERFLTSQEIDLLLEAAEGESLLFCHIALETGQRRRAIELLEWGRVDFKGGWIDFRIPGKQVTKKRQAIVPIHPRLRPILEEAYARRTNNWVLGSDRDRHRELHRLFKSMGWDDVSAHTLRHTCATRMAMAGVPMNVIADVLGNSIDVVMKTYAHLNKGEILNWLHKF